MRRRTRTREREEIFAGAVTPGSTIIVIFIFLFFIEHWFAVKRLPSIRYILNPLPPN